MTSETSNTNSDGAMAMAMADETVDSSGNGTSESVASNDGTVGQRLPAFGVDDRPILCILEEEQTYASATMKSVATKKRQRCRMFRVVRSRGKAMASGGFGVTVVSGLSGNEQGEDGEDDDDDDDNGSEKQGAMVVPSDEVTEKTKTNTTNTTVRSAEYLFIEEVLFLHEKGLLGALLPSSLLASEEEGGGTADANTNGISGATPLTTSQLYQLLPSMGISLSVYRVYSHLRSQDFRVLRHDPDRYDILCQQQQDQEERRKRQIERQKQQQVQQEKTSGDSDPLPPLRNPRRQSLRLRRRIRESIQNAPPPAIPDPNGSGSGALALCWDAYTPNSNFGKTHPGLPDFYVTATYFNVPTVRFSDLKALVRDKCNGIPLKVATVSDSGTVVMFGVTDYGIPPLEKKSTSSK